MSLFDLLFIAVFLTTVGLLVVAIFSRKRLPILGALGAGLAVYFAVVVLVSLVLPRKVIGVGQTQCFDDWCVAVDRVERKEIGPQASYEVTLCLSSRARRIEQRENNLSVYVADGAGNRYNSTPESVTVPFNVLLQPGQSVAAARTFLVPADVSGPVLIVTHEGGFPIGWFIIGYDTWFRKPPMLPLPTRKSREV